ncbi:MAG TPA: M48 family metallopeptidase [Chthoniobacterales bacterium]|jgi:STE24 endopeptidase|nr:M48 family metallopeptidase [Chthoniobacterales bacterium]
MKSSVAVVVLLFVLGLSAFAQLPSPTVAEPTPLPTPSIAPGTDPATATRAWLDTVPADKRARSDAYFEGGYWLILWNFLMAAAISIFLLASGISARLRDFAERVTGLRFLQVVLYAVPVLFLIYVLGFPLNAYENFFREHAYGMANQSFGQWFGEQLKLFFVNLVVTSLLLIGLYAVFRRAPRTWWVWGTIVSIIFTTLGIMLAPVYIQPLFNKYTPLSDPAISEPILAMARANQIPVSQVFEVDASRQTKRVSANVSGFMGTTRIALNDNLLKRCTLPEIREVMAHEMGHYILNHSFKLTTYFSFFFLLGFIALRVFFQAAVNRWGQGWGVRGIADPAGLPLLSLIFSTVFFLLTPIINTTVRVHEREADAFSVNTAREPDAFAMVALKLGEYRKLDPSPLEEFIFFDHPSGRARIRMAMDWKAARLPAGKTE